MFVWLLYVGVQHLKPNRRFGERWLEAHIGFLIRTTGIFEVIRNMVHSLKVDTICMVYKKLCIFILLTHKEI